jgi:hypothetical protein
MAVTSQQSVLRKVGRSVEWSELRIESCSGDAQGSGDSSQREARQQTAVRKQIGGGTPVPGYWLRVKR